MINNQYDYSISFTRVSAMFFIIICHLGSHFESALIGQFFNVGVPIFFLISGYLYGDREIHNIKAWIEKRMIRLYVPLLLWGIVMSVLTLIRGRTLPSIKEYIYFLLNLQGLNFVFYKMPYLTWGPWFFTVIMICYFFVVAYQWVEKRYKKIDRIFYYGGTISLLIFILSAYVGISIPLSFLVGYGLKKRRMFERSRPYNIIVSIVTFVIAVIIRVGTKRYLDGSILYDQVIVVITHLMIAAAFYIGVRWLFETFGDVMFKITTSRLFRYLDKISIYVYISHDWFISELFGMGLPFAVQLLLYFTEVIVVASVLCFVGDKLSMRLDKIISVF